MTGSGVKTIFIYKRWTKNPEMRNPPSEFCPISGDLDELGIPDLTRMSLIKWYWMKQKQNYQFWIIKGLSLKFPPAIQVRIRVSLGFAGKSDF